MISSNNLAGLYTQSVCDKNLRISCIFFHRFSHMASTVGRYCSLCTLVSPLCRYIGQSAVHIGRERTSIGSSPSLHSPPPFQWGGQGEMLTSNNSMPCPPPPLTSPTWAEASRGEARDSNDSTPARPAHTYTGSPPTAHSQYMAWVRCRRGGIPAKLVLDTDGCTEEVTLWFRSTAAGGKSSAADTAAHTNAPAHVSGKRRRERARRARRREERRREAAGRRPPPATPTPGMAATTATIPLPPPPETPHPTEPAPP